MTVKVDIPIQLEVGAELLRADASRELATRVAEVVTQNLAVMAAELAAEGHHGPAAVAEPKLQWTGPGLHALSARDRARSGGQLLDAVRKAGQRFAAASRSARLDPSGDWRVERLEFVAAFDRVLALVDRLPWNRAEQLRVRYADHGSAEVHGMAWVITVQRPVSWSRVYGAVNAERRRDLGDDTLFGYFWDATRTEELRGLDPRHLQGLPRLEHEEMTAPSSSAATALWRLAPGTRVIFVAAGLPEVDADVYLELGRAVTVQVGLHEAITAVNGVLDLDRLQEVYQLGEQAVLDLLQHDPDAQLDIWVLPFVVKRQISSGPLRALLIDRAAEQGAPASPLEQIRPLGAGARNALPGDVTAPGLALARGKPAPPDHVGRNDPWHPGWSGVYLRPILDRDQLHARASFAHAAEDFEREARQVVAMLGLRNGLVSAARHDAVWKWAARWQNARPEAFERLLAELDRLGALARLFESWLEEKLYPSQLRILIRSCLRTRYARHPKLRELIAAVEHWEIAHLKHDYDVDAQQIRLFHDDADGHRITAAGASSDPSAGVVAETRSYYSRQTKVKKLRKAALNKLAEPVRRKAGALIGAMICDGNDGMTADELFARATQEASREVEFTDADYETVPLQLSLRVLRLERRNHGGVTDVVVHWEPVRKIDKEPWTSTGKPIEGPPAQFEAALTSYHVDHLMDWLVTPVVLGGAIMLTAGVAFAAKVTVGQLVVFIVFNELMYVISSWHDGVSLNGFLMAAWMAEIEAIGFKGVSRVLGLTGEGAGAAFNLVARRLGSELTVKALTIKMMRAQATKWILFALRGAVIGVEVGAGSVLGLVAQDLLMMSRCTGWSSADEYWKRFKWGVLIGAGIELVAAPLLGPPALAMLQKARTLLEAVGILRKSVRNARELGQLLDASAEAMEQALDRTVSGQPARTLAARFRERLLEVLKAFKSVGREYESRAYRNMIALIDEGLSDRASKVLLRLLARQSEHELDELLARIARSQQIGVADLLDLLADLDNPQLARLVANGGVARLAESPSLLALLQRTPQRGWRLLAEVFDDSVGDCEAYVARFDRAPPGHLDQAVELLLRPGNLVPRDELADAILHRGRLDAAQISELDEAARLHAWIKHLRSQLDAQTRSRLDALVTGKTPKQLTDLVSKIGDGSRLERLLKVFEATELEEMVNKLNNPGELVTMLDHLGRESTEKILGRWMANQSGGVAKANRFLARLEAGVGKELAETASIRATSIIIDSNTAIALEMDADPVLRGMMNPSQQGRVAYVKSLPAGTELRIGNVTVGEVGGVLNLKGIPIEVLRDSHEYATVVNRLAAANVGGATGFADRALLADILFAKTEAGVAARFLTSDGDLVRSLARLAGIDTNTIGGFPGILTRYGTTGFSVTIEGRTIVVIPIR